MLVINRPARIESDEIALDAEFRSARWTYHRLLDFEDEHQAVLDRVADEVAPGIVRVARIIATLSRRARRAERSSEGTWWPNPRPELASHLKQRLAALRTQRNADPRWSAALGWADEEVGDAKAPRRRKAKDPAKIKRRKTETEEAFVKRFALLTSDETEEHFAAKLASPRRDTRRDQHRKALYAQMRIYWGTWNGLLKSVEAARKAVLKLRKEGSSAKWRRPRWDEQSTIYADRGGFRIVAQEGAWWTVEMRLANEWVRFRAHTDGAKWPRLPADAQFVTCQLTRRRDGHGWTHSMSLTVDAQKDMSAFALSGTVCFDWGHREHGHPTAADGLRAFTWLGDDGRSGEVLLPIECRRAQDEIDQIKSRMDETFNARKASMALPDHNRHTYGRRVMRSGVRTREECDWLTWERRYERMLDKRRRRIKNLRRETYLMAVRGLRRCYARFGFEGESVKQLRKVAVDEQGPRRPRQNRDLCARYEFVAICERFGAELTTVPARNTTRECPDCGFIGENGPELLYACPGCGVVRDKDRGACRVILGRVQEALAIQAGTC